MLKGARKFSRLLGERLCRFGDHSLSAVPREIRSKYRDAMIYRGLTPGSQLSIDESVFLGALVQQSDPTRPIIEIGTLYGFSALIITLFKPAGQPLLTVDNYSWNSLGISIEAQRLAVRKRLHEAVQHRNVTVLDMDKDEFYQSYDSPPPSLFFCDANHSYEATLSDLKWARNIGASIICGDDYNERNCPGVVQAVDEMGGARRVVGELFLLESVGNL